MVIQGRRKAKTCFVVCIALGTIQAATDLLEKKGSIYSSRPRNIVAGEILCRNMRGLGMPYGQRWRNWRSVSLPFFLTSKILFILHLAHACEYEH